MSTPQPLSGTRIVSLEQFGAGPYGTMILADLGARVIEIENPAPVLDVALALKIDGRRPVSRACSPLGADNPELLQPAGQGGVP